MLPSSFEVVGAVESSCYSVKYNSIKEFADFARVTDLFHAQIYNEATAYTE